MFILDVIAKLTKRNNYRRLLNAGNNPEKVQLAILRKILQQNSGTKIGKKYHFSKIDDYETFKAIVPIRKLSNTRKTWLRFIVAIMSS